jgi:predicted dehydrogenase
VTVLEGFHYFFHPVTQRAFTLAADGTIGGVTNVEVRMAMPSPGADDPRWSLALAGGALMDLGCYGVHVMRSLGRLAMPGIEGRPSITRAHVEQRTPGVDAWLDVEFVFPGGATGLSTNSMVAEDHCHSIRIVGTAGELLVHEFIKPNGDDRLTVTTSAGTTVEHLGTKASYTHQLEAFAAHVEHGTPLPFGTDDAVDNMAFVDAAYRAAGMQPR